MADFATLNYGGNSYNLPVITGTENEKAVDISKLRKESGLVTLDYGYTNTGSTKSQITFVDGEKGKSCRPPGKRYSISGKEEKKLHQRKRLSDIWCSKYW